MEDKVPTCQETLVRVNQQFGTVEETPVPPAHRGAAAVAPGCLSEAELLLAAQQRMQRDWTEVKLRLNRNLFF